MRIQTRNIPEAGLDVEFAIPHDVMAQSAAKEDHLKNLFPKDVDCHIHLEITRKDVFVSGNADTFIHPVCDRCLETFDQPFQVHLVMTCSPEPTPRQSGDSYQESEEGLTYYRNNEIDLSEIVREQILLDLPMGYLCHQDCLGLCPQCGNNLNAGEHTCTKRKAK